MSLMAGMQSSRVVLLLGMKRQLYNANKFYSFSNSFSG